MTPNILFLPIRKEGDRMRKWLIWTIVLMLGIPVGLVDPVPASADTETETGEPITMYANKWTVLPETPTAPVIDGALSDNVWSGAAALDDFRTAYYNEPVPDGPSYKMSYDSANLYFGGTFASEDKAILEKIELVVSTQTYGEPHYVISIPVTPLAGASKTDWNIGREIAKENPQRVNVNAFTAAATDSGGRTAVEVSVPLSALGAAMPAPGTEWRVNVVHVHHLGTKPLITWVPIRTSTFWDTGSTVTFKGNIVDEGRLGSLFFGQTPIGQSWVPENTELRYDGFTEKTLSFERSGAPDPDDVLFTLKWKSPTGDWEPLNTVTSVTYGSRYEITFEHPPVLDFGLVELQVYSYRANNPGGGKFAIVSFDRDSLIEAGLAVAVPADPPGGTVQVVYAPASQLVLDTLELIPDKTGFIFTGLPEMPELHPDQLYKLSADNKSLVSVKTGTVYPNTQYPETNVVTAINRKGETLEYPYYEDAEGKRYFLSAHLWYLQKNYATGQTEKIAKTDALGAARLLYRFAQAYEGYVPTTDYIWRNYPINITSGPPFNYWGGMWYRWSVADLNSLRPLLRAYAEVKKTNALSVLSQEVGEDVEQMLVEQMFIPSMQYALSYPYTLGNMNYTQWLGLIDAGKMLNEPDYIHNAFEWMQDYVETQFLSDGYWKEVAPSYHVQSTSGLDQAVNALDGYTDPAGYASPRTGRRFDDLNMAQDYPIIERSLKDNNLLVYPDGKMLPLQDSWASDKARSPIQNAGSFLMPAAGIGRLAAGSGTAQSQLWLQFEPKYGHNHYAPLQLNLYAEGQELLPDLGYTYTRDRSFSLSALGHNTVVVDSKDMKIDSVSKHGGKIGIFAPVGTVQAMRADQKEAYAGLDQYSREPWFISFPGADGGQGYVIDLFRVSGGNRHEYTLQGDANRDAVFETELTLDEYGPYLLPPGTQVQEPEQFNDKGSAEGHYYGYISVRDVQKAQLQNDRYDVTLVTSENGAEKAKMKITGLLEPGSNELYLGRSPSIRSTRLSGKSKDTNDEADKYDMPKLVLRRDGSSLKSTFVTAMEPYKGTAGPRIDTVDRLQLTEGPEGAAAIKVTYGNTTDILISSPGGATAPVVVDDMTLRGKMGFIRTVDGIVQSMYLIGGTQLTKDGQTLTGDGTVEGVITATKRKVNGDPYDGIVTAATIDAATADALRGKYAVVTHPDQTTGGYRIKEIVSEPGGAVIVFDEHDPGFEIRPDGSSRMNYYPAKSWTGTHTFLIDNVDVYDMNPLQSVSLQASKKDLLAGESASLTVQAARRDGSALPPGAAKTTYASSDEDVVRVDAEGNVKAIGEGTASITAIVDWNGVTKTSSLLFTSQNRAYRSFDFVNLPILQQSASTLYVSGSNTVQFEANQPGESIAFEFEVDEEAPYDIGIKPFMAASYGIYQISIDGNPIASFDFYAASAGASAVFRPLGTVTLAPGSHTMTLANIGKHASASNYKFGVSQLEVKEKLLEPPALPQQSGVVYAEEAVAISFADDPVWRGQLSSVAVNGMPLPSGQYTLAPGSIAFAAGALGGAGPKRISIGAEGYRHAIAELRLTPASALSGLTVVPGPIVPAFDPGIAEYAVSVSNAVYFVSVTASTYRPDAQLSVAGQTYTGAGTFTLPLQVGENPFPVVVQSAGGQSSVYTLTVYRAGTDVAPTGTVTGTVYVLGNEPLPGAELRLAGYSRSAVAGGSGGYAMTDVPAGQHRLIVTHPEQGRTESVLFRAIPGQSVALSVYYPFIDTAPPVLTVARTQVSAGMQVLATADEAGKLYLVPEGTAADAASIIAASAAPNGTFANASAHAVTALNTIGFAKGKYKLYGIDTSNNLSLEPVSITIVQAALGAIDETDPTLTYAGLWSSYTGNYVGGKMLLSKDTAGSVEIPFFGTRAKWVGAKNAAYGIGNVYLDGQLAATVDLYNPALLTKQDLFDTGTLAPGMHVLKIVPTGQKGASASNTYVSFDAVQVTELGYAEPVVSQVTAGPVYAGTPISAVSSENGLLYLVPSATAANWGALEQAVSATGQSVNGVKIAATAGTTASFQTANMAHGQYKVYAVNPAGVLSAGSAPITVIATTSSVIDSANPLVAYTGSWTTSTNAGYYGGTERIGTAANSTVEVEFYGSRGIVYGTLASNGGLADIYLDGQYIETYDFYRGGTGVLKSKIWDTGSLPLGMHTLKIVNTGDKHPLSKNTWIRFDYMQTTAP